MCDILFAWMYCTVLWTDILSLHDKSFLFSAAANHQHIAYLHCSADWSLQCFVFFQREGSLMHGAHTMHTVTQICMQRFYETFVCHVHRLLISVRTGTTVGHWWLQHTSWQIPTADGTSLQVPSPPTSSWAWPSADCFRWPCHEPIGTGDTA